MALKSKIHFLFTTFLLCTFTFSAKAQEDVTPESGTQAASDIPTPDRSFIGFRPDAANTQDLEEKLPVMAKEDLEEIFFDEGTHDRSLWDQAVTLYENFFHDQYPDYDGSLKPDFGYTRYLILDDENPKRFIGLYVTGPDMEDRCPSGCGLYVFENIGNDEWKTVMGLTTHRVWIGKRPDENTPRNIYLKVYTISSAGHPEELVNQWRYQKGKYEHSGQFLAL